MAAAPSLSAGPSQPTRPAASRAEKHTSGSCAECRSTASADIPMALAGQAHGHVCTVRSAAVLPRCAAGNHKHQPHSPHTTHNNNYNHYFSMLKFYILFFIILVLALWSWSLSPLPLPCISCCRRSVSWYFSCYRRCLSSSWCSSCCRRLLSSSCCSCSNGRIVMNSSQSLKKVDFR